MEAAGTDPGSARVFRLLHELMGMHARLGDDAEPFAAMLIMAERRSIAPGDVHGAQNDVLAQVVSELPYAELRARVGDVAFHNRWLDHELERWVRGG